MDCPICGGRFPVGQIQGHVEGCLIEQDALVARKVQQELNGAVNRGQGALPPAQAPANGAGGAFPKAEPQSFVSPSSAAPQRYGAQTILTPPNYVAAAPNATGTRTAAPAQAPQNLGRSQVGSSVTGALQADIDTYNHKIGLAHKQLHLLHDSLESFAHRVSLLEMRKHERIVPPVELTSLPPPRYMAIKPTHPTQPTAQQPRGSYVPSQQAPQLVPGAVTPAQTDKRQRFFQTAQRFYNDKSGANMFFAGAANANSPQTKPLPAPTSVSQAPIIPAPSHIPQHSVQPAKPPAPVPKPAILPPQIETGITDIHVAQIESKWISMILQYPDDAEDLILAHLTMLFNQRIKEKKAINASSEHIANPAEKGDDPIQKSSVIGNGGKTQVEISVSAANPKSSSESGGGMPHPLSEYVSTMIETWNEPFSRMREPTQETLQTAVSTINRLISTLEDVVLDYYVELSVRSVPRHASYQQHQAAEYREQMVRQGVRSAVWPLFYDGMMQLIHAKVSAEDEVCNQKMKEYMTMNPAHLGIPRDYWLIEMSDSQTSPEGRVWSMPPYYLAIQTFKELSSLKMPEAKLKCVVKSARDLVKSVASFHSFFGRNPDKYPVGGDELLPIFTYIVIRSGVKNLISETTFMELFVSDDQARGEMGYILATLQTVIAFLSCLDNSSISQSVDSVFKSIANELDKKPLNSENQQKQGAANFAPQNTSLPPANANPIEIAPSTIHQPHQPLKDPHNPPPSAQQGSKNEGPSNGLSSFHRQDDSFKHESIELEPIGVQQGSFFEQDESLDTFIAGPTDLSATMMEMSDFNPRNA